MRKGAAKIFMVSSVLLWGTWFGGQLFNWAVLLPRWLSKPPQSMQVYESIGNDGTGFFFFALNPFIFLFAAVAVVLAWKWARRSRKWLLLSSAISFTVCLVLILYLAPLIHSTANAAVKGSLNAVEIADRIKTWRRGNEIRIVFEFLGFLCSVLALQSWSSEAETHQSSKPLSN